MLTGTKKMFLAAAVITAAIMPLGLMVQAAEQGQTITKMALTRRCRRMLPTSQAGPG